MLLTWEHYISCIVIKFVTCEIWRLNPKDQENKIKISLYDQSLKLN